MYMSVSNLYTYVVSLCTVSPDTQPQHIDPNAKEMFVLCSNAPSTEVRIRFSCRDDQECQDWTKWFMRATEQDFNPQNDAKKGGWSLVKDLK